jgi:hypothetical protein
MNIGPKGDGSFDTKDLAILNGIGKWLNRNGESIYGSTAGDLPLQSWGVSTMKGNKLYLHVFKYPVDGKLYVGGLKSTPSRLYMLSNKKQLTATRLNDMDVVINLPKQAPDTINTVIVIELKDKLQVDTVRYISPGVSVTRLLAYDAKQSGKGFGFGDGKTNRYYVDGWKSQEQGLGWAFRTRVPGTFKLVAKYLAGAETSGGKFQLQIDKNTIPADVVTDRSATKVITQELGVISLNAGRHNIFIKPLQLTNEELMKLLELQLINVSGNK